MAEIWCDVDAAVTIPVNLLPLIDDTDFKSRETGVAYDAAGMDLVWNFQTTAGVQTQTAVTPTTGGDYDWTEAGDAMYKIEMTASGGASINNDAEGFGWFSGVIDGILPFRGPVVGFRAAGLNNTLIDSAYSATRGLGGTALPDAASDAAGGLVVSDAGGKDFDAMHTAIGTDGAGLTAINLPNQTMDILGNITGSLSGSVGSVTGAVGSVAAAVTADVTKIDGVVLSAQKLSDQYDGTGVAGDTFPATQAQLSGITNSGSAVNTVADSYVLTSGTQSANTISATEALDGTNHEHNDDGGVMDLYYEFEIGSGSPSSVKVDGYLLGNNDNLEVYGFDWVASAWVQIGTLNGKVAATNETNSYDLTTAMVGMGANLGKVRIRYTDGAFTLTSATLAVDRILVAFNQGAGGYSDGIEVDTNASNTNTVPGVDGIKGNPVSTWAAALALSASTGIAAFHIINGSEITLTANSDNFTMAGDNWTLALGGQSIGGLHVRGALAVSGTATAGAAQPDFHDCSFGTATVPPSAFQRCGFATTLTGASAGEYIFHQCYSEVAGTGTPIFVFTGLGSATGINNRGWTGGATYTLDSDCTLSHEVLAGGATTVTTGGADVEIRGTTRKVTVVMSAAETVQFVGVTGPVAVSGTTSGKLNLYGVIASLADTTSGPGADISNLTVSNAQVEAIKDVTDVLPDSGALTTIGTDTAKIGTTVSLDGGAATVGGMLAKMADDNAGADFDAGTDSLQEIRDRGDAAWTTGAGGSANDRSLLQETTIDVLTNQQQFTLVAGSIDDGAYEGCTIVIEDAATATQKAVGVVTIYNGATRGVGLSYDPAVFGMLAGDKVYILANTSIKPRAKNRDIGVTAAGVVGINWANVENPSATAILSQTTINNVATNDDMRGTDSAALASVCTEGRLAELDAAKIPADVDGIKAVTDNLPDSGALTAIGTDTARLTAARAQVLDDWINDGRLDVILDAIKTVTDADNNLSAAQVNAEVVDVMKVDTIAQRTQGAPPAAPTFEEAMSYLFMMFRQKVTQTSTFQTMFDDAGTGEITKAPVSGDGSTFTKGEFVTGT